MTPETLDWGMKAGLPPGNIAGYLTAFQRFGTMSLKEVLAPAIDYAEHGYPMDRTLATALDGAQKRLSEYPTTAKLFFPNGKAPNAGDLFKNPGLAATLKKLVEAEQDALKHGKSRQAAIQAAYDRFYKGDIADEFASFFKENGGLITKADLAAVKAEWSEPLHITYRGYDVSSNTSSSRGGYELEMALNLVEPYDLAKMGNESPGALHLRRWRLSRSPRLTFTITLRTRAPPRFPPGNSSPSSSPECAASLSRPIRPYPFPPGDNSPPEQRPPRRRSITPKAPYITTSTRSRSDTTGFSIIDPFGDAVACTPTLGGGFGNGVVVGDTGLLLNNGMRLGSTSPYPDSVNYVNRASAPCSITRRSSS